MATKNAFTANGDGARRLVQWTAALIVLGVLGMEGAGAMIAFGVKAALLQLAGTGGL